MDDTMFCPVKINITLRVLNQREDGYHELFSAFWKKKGTEGLTIRRCSDENREDMLNVTGAVIEGENILHKVLAAARRFAPDLPAFDISLEKEYPQGSGIGAGSGNAAALVDFFRDKYGFFRSGEEITRLGADVAFLCCGSEVAFAGGVGEKLKPQTDIKGLCWTLAFPTWQSNTRAAYASLDRFRAKDGWTARSFEACEAEARAITDKLRRGERAGLLPNDFTEVLLAEHGEYAAAFDASAAGSLAWGLCGSGSAVFAVCDGRADAERAARVFKAFDWINKTSILE